MRMLKIAQALEPDRAERLVHGIKIIMPPGRRTRDMGSGQYIPVKFHDIQVCETVIPPSPHSCDGNRQVPGCILVLTFS